jgi:hypothetical protein
MQGTGSEPRRVAQAAQPDNLPLTGRPNLS